MPTTENKKGCKHEFLSGTSGECQLCHNWIPPERPSQEKLGTFIGEEEIPPTEEGWIKEFDDEFIKYGFSSDNWPKVKSFIRTLLSKARKEERARCLSILDEMRHDVCTRNETLDEAKTRIQDLTLQNK